MIQVKCIQKYRDKNNHIYGYKLIDLNGQTQDVKAENLKRAIKNRQVEVVNLTLTEDGRLMDKTEKVLQTKVLGKAPTQLQAARYILTYAWMKKPLKDSILELIDTKTGRVLKVSYMEMKTLAKKAGIKGVIMDDNKITDVKAVSIYNLADKSAKLPYAVLRFFNRLQLELSDIPDQVDRMVKMLNAGDDFRATAGMSRGDYAKSLYQDYLQIKDVFSPKDFKDVYEHNPKGKYYAIYEEFVNYAEQQHKNRYSANAKPIPDSYYDKLLKLTGMPAWFKEYMKQDLYCLEY